MCVSSKNGPKTSTTLFLLLVFNRMIISNALFEQAFLVLKMPPDGDCLFHALAIHEDGDGAELRKEVSDYLENTAEEEADIQACQAFYDEADHLRGPKESNWGGHTSLVAYTKMRGRKVYVHTLQADGSCHVQDATHATVPGDSIATHVLYNGATHYDALLHLEEASHTNVEPAWANQSLPAKYFQQREITTTSASTAAAAPVPEPPNKKARAASTAAAAPVPEPPKKKAREASTTATPPAPQPPKKKARVANPADSQNTSNADPSETQQEHRRYYRKTTPPPELRDSIMDEISNAKVGHISETEARHMESLLEDGMQQLMALAMH